MNNEMMSEKSLSRSDLSRHAGLFAGLAAGFGAGLLAMYFLDPARGARRRALVADKFVSAKHRLPRAAKVTARDVSNRVRGAFVEASHLLYTDDASDSVIEARVRSKLGRVCSHPHSIHVTSQNGYIVLDGVILTDELSDVIASAGSVRGVKSVENRMRHYDAAALVPSLQGGSGKRREQQSEFDRPISQRPGRQQIH